MNENSWIDAGASEDLALGQSLLLRHQARQYALFRSEDGELRACDNACPHEGYPLVQGYTEGCVLTCAWHNFKFDLRDGRCMVGEEDLGVYPLRERGGRLEIDLTPRHGDDHQQRLWSSLESALHANRLEQTARDAARLLEAGVAASRIAVFAAHFDARHAPWGSSHALPVAVDILRYLEREDEDPLLALYQVLELAAESGHLQPSHPQIAARAGSDDPCELRRELLVAIENEVMDNAESVLRAAAAAEIPWPQIESWLLEACCEHFLSFGHQLIYLSKITALRTHADPTDYLEILVGLLRDIVYGTREDTLPPMLATRRALKEHRPEFEAWMKLQTRPREWSREARHEFRATVLDARSSEVPAALSALLESGVSRHDLADELVIAAAERVLRFDPAIELDAGVRENWLHVTHTLTFAAAVRSVLAASDAPFTLALLFHSAHFIRHKKPLDRASIDSAGTDPALHGESGADPVAEGIAEAALRGDRQEAIERLSRYIDQRGMDPELVAAVEDLALHHRAVRPIRAAHVLKTLIIGLEETSRLGDDPRAALPLSAALAFASASMDERGAVRITREAGQFVREGRPPRRLTS